MRITGLAGTLAARSVDNAEVLDLIAHHSRAQFAGDLTKTLRMVGRLFEKSGVEARCWPAPGERPMALVQDAFERALDEAGLVREDVDLLIYASVVRGFTEPANSTFVAKALGLRCRNFDVVDACMGWVSAAQVVDAQMRAGTVRHAVVVNVEIPMTEDGPVYPKNFALGTAAELAYKYPSFTLGNAVTVTVLSEEDRDNFHFAYVNRPDLSELCTIALPGWRAFCTEGDVARIAPTGGRYQFSSYGGELHEAASEELINVLEKGAVARERLDHVFSHTSSPKQWDHFAEVGGIRGKLHRVGHWTGNIVTASVPFGMVDAAAQGVLRRGESCLAWVGSAGMVFSAVSFTY